MKKIKIYRDEVHEKCNWRCAYCGIEISLKEMQVEHMIPKANFEIYVGNWFKVPPFLKHLRLWQENHSDNLFPSCRKCNHYKSTMDLESFRREISKQLERVQENFNYSMAKRYWLIQETPKEIKFFFETI